jgi:hypothetical protein
MKPEIVGFDEPRISLTPSMLRPLYLSLLGIGVVLVMIGMDGTWSVQILGCFAAITARIVQAEHHRYLDNSRRLKAPDEVRPR